MSKTFTGPGKKLTKALDGISLIAKPGEITGLAGPDGAGKTTLLRCAAGLLIPDSGVVKVLGLDSVKDTLNLQSRIGYMPQQFGLYQELTVQENLDLYADLQGLSRERRQNRFSFLLQTTELKDFTRRRAGDLSGGMKQKLGLACALLKDPRLLLLDEPTVGVDPVSRRDLWRIISTLVNEAGVGVLLATSYPQEADRCSRIVVLHRGRKLADETPADFHQLVRGRVFTMTPQPGEIPRILQAELMGRPGIIDVMIRSGKLRALVEEGVTISDPQTFPLPCCQDMEPAEPDFEDAFLALLQRAEHQLHSDFSGPERTGQSFPETGNTVIRAQELTKFFGNFKAVSGISFEVRRGEIFGLLGPNGAGKTTTFRMLCGLLKVSAGEVQVAGEDLRRAGSRARSRLGYMAQMFSLYRQLSAKANLDFYGRAYGLSGRRLQQRLNWALDEFHLRGREEVPAGLLPAGFRQRLAMATALIHEPAILFLDEPTSGADPLARREFWLRINGFARRGVTVIVTTHFMEEAEYCDRLLIMSRGRELIQGSPAEIRRLGRQSGQGEATIEDAFIALAEGRALQLGSQEGNLHD